MEAPVLAAVTASAERGAAIALSTAGAWRCLKNAQLVARLKAFLSEPGPDADAEERLGDLLSSPNGIASLETAASALLQDAGASMPTDLQGLLDLLVVSLAWITDGDGKPSVPISLPDPRCVLCGLTVTSEWAGVPVNQRGVPFPYDPFDESELGEGEELLGRSLLRSMVQPLGAPGYTLWIKQKPCGHVLHDHCSVKMYAWRDSPQEAPTCPACGVARTDEESAWQFGFSGTPYELGLETTSEKCDDLAWRALFDPRSVGAIRGWLPETLSAELKKELTMAGASAAARWCRERVIGRSFQESAAPTPPLSPSRLPDRDVSLEDGLARLALTQGEEPARCASDMRTPYAIGLPRRRARGSGGRSRRGGAAVGSDAHPGLEAEEEACSGRSSSTGRGGDLSARDEHRGPRGCCACGGPACRRGGGD